MDAIVFVSLLVGLAAAAPRWGYDSTDGVDSPEYGRRAAWLGGSHGAGLRGGEAARRDERAASDSPSPSEGGFADPWACRPALAGGEVA